MTDAMERFRNISLKSLLRKAGGTRRRRIAWLSVILTVLIVAAVAVFLMRPRTQEPPLPRVEVETVTTGDVNIYGEYVGRIFMTVSDLPQYTVRRTENAPAEEKKEDEAHE